MEPKNIKQKIVIELKPRKTEICRFYLRGLCIYDAKDCHFAHGVWDLIYYPWKEGEEVIYDYSKVDNSLKEKVFKGQRNYRILYDYQAQKVFTQMQLNTDRKKRQIVRNQMHSQMYNDFMDLLQCTYPDALFTESFLLREFSRVGFNKTISVIKLTHICSYVCDTPSSRFFKISLRLPPYANKEQTYILKSLPEEENIAFYKNCYQQWIENEKKEDLSQADIKKYLFSVQRANLSILPLNLLLKNKKMSFSSFLKLINNQQSSIVEADQKTLLATAVKFIQDKIDNDVGYCQWNDVYKYIGQQHKVNNANITNPLKHILVREGYLFLYFPVIQFLTSIKKLFSWSFPEIKGCKSVCQCSYKQMYPEEELLLHLLSFQQLPPQQSFDIFDMQSLIKYSGQILRSKFLSVDIQGRLRKGGYIELIQINNGTHTFIIDIYQIHNNGDNETFQLCKIILRNAFCNPKILKIFHDSRHDSLVLHEIMQTCVVNIFDTSAVETLIEQLDCYKNSKNKKDVLNKVTSIHSPGLNLLLKKYNAPHGINKNKQWFHQLWRKGHTQLFDKRPLHPQYRQYCIKDVLDLPHLHQKMSQGLSGEFTDWISSHYIRAGYLYTIQDE